MFFNNLKIAIRNILKLKFFSFINISGLVIGMTVCLLMAMYIVNEMSYESFHRKKDSIYRITVIWGTEENKMKFAGVMPALAPALNENARKWNMPCVSKTITVRYSRIKTMRKSKKGICFLPIRKFLTSSHLILWKVIRTRLWWNHILWF